MYSNSTNTVPGPLSRSQVAFPAASDPVVAPQIQPAQASPAPGKIKIQLAQARQLDCLALSRLLRDVPDFDLLGSCTTLDEFRRQCFKHQPDIVVLDARYPDDGAFAVADELRDHHSQLAIMFLDEKISHVRANRIINMYLTSYFSKHSGFEEICHGIHSLARGKVTHDQDLERILALDELANRFQLRADAPSAARLTVRETQVMKLLAEGNSVRSTAARLDIASSTVDNHKSKLMKKLAVHKMTDITRIAMREGLIE